MEKRLPLAAHVGHNFLMPADVNDDHLVTAVDALAIINTVSRQAEAERGSAGPESESVDASLRDMFVDVNDDGRATAVDALRVVNYLARESESADDRSDATEYLVGEDGVRAKFELQVRGSGQAELEVRLDGAPADGSFDVVIGGETVGQIQTDAQGRGKLELKYGGNNPELPDPLASADALTPVSIGTIVHGALGSLGEMETGDDVSDGMSDGDPDGMSDGDPDGMSDGGPDGMSDGAADGMSDGDSDHGPVAGATSLAVSPSIDDLIRSTMGDSGVNSGDVSGHESGDNSHIRSQSHSDGGSDGGSDR
jgi:hypothetical protein